MFWDNFYSACANKGTKPNPVAKEIGISSASVTKWKNGTTPNGEVLAKIADYLDVSVDYLLGREEKTLTVGRRNRLQGAVIIKKAPDPSEVKSYTTDSPVRDAIIDKVKELDDAQLDRLLGYLEGLTGE